MLTTIYKVSWSDCDLFSFWTHLFNLNQTSRFELNSGLPVVDNWISVHISIKFMPTVPRLNSASVRLKKVLQGEQNKHLTYECRIPPPYEKLWLQIQIYFLSLPLPMAGHLFCNKLSRELCIRDRCSRDNVKDSKR